MVEKIDLGTFTESKEFYDKMELILTVKNFNLQEIRDRYIKSKKETSTNKIGSVERRKPGKGGVVRVIIEKGQLTNYEVLNELKEPRGIACKNGVFAFSAENEVYVVYENKIETIKNEWFSYIHTIDFNEDGSRILISSSGFDCIFEYDIYTLEKTYEWFAWENGFNVGFNPKTNSDILLSRTAVQSSIENIVIDNPKEQVLPTAMRAAFINSVVYDSSDYSKMLATFFHEGKVFSIDMATGIAGAVIAEMKNPHGGMKHGNDYWATSTGTGQVVKKNNTETRYEFKNLEGKPSELEGMEWLQNSKIVNGKVVTIDSNRTSFVIYDVDENVIDMVPYNNNLAIQDMVECSLTDKQIQLIKSM